MLKVILKKYRRGASKPAAWSALGLVVWLACLPAGFMANTLAQAITQELVVTVNFAGREVFPDASLNLRLSRPLRSTDGKLAILIGKTDITNLLSGADTNLSYTPKVVPLPAGQSEVVVYLVSPAGEWKEVARFTLRVSVNKIASDAAAAPESNKPTRASLRKWGFDKAALIPALTINIKSQPAEAHFPFSNRPERPTYTDVTIQGGIKTNLERGLFGMENQFDFAGSSFQKEALRFGQLGDDAPQIDLSGYLMQFKVGKARLMAGHVSFGSNRYLINSFSSRGMSAYVPLWSRADFNFAAMNGTSIVGWDNFFGLDRRKHQIVTGTLGFEFLRERPSGLRLEVGLLNGSLLPLSNFNQGNINDAERSRGLGLRVIASDKSQRLKLDSGFTLSRFTNPRDPLLEQRSDTVEVRERTRNARYADISYRMFKDIDLTKTQKANLTLNYRHEKIDPLYRSVAAFVQPNKLQNQWEAVGGIGQITASYSHLRFNDNLDNIPSILKSLSRRNGLIVGAPLGSLFGGVAKPSPWLPRFGYTYDRIHQFGAFIPVNADFKAPQVPDQIGTNQGIVAEWQGPKQWRFGYRFNHSSQDNFGEKREDTKLRNMVNALTVGLSPASVLDLNFDLSAESLNSLDNNANKDKDRTDSTYRMGVNANWRMSTRMTFTGTVINSLAGSVGDLSRTSRGRNTELDLQWSSRFALEKYHLRKVQGQFFVRYANRFSKNRADLFGIHSLIKTQTFSTGLSFNFF